MKKVLLHSNTFFRDQFTNKSINILTICIIVIVYTLKVNKDGDNLMKKLYKYIFKYRLLFFTRVVTISLASLAVIGFDFIMGFIVDIFSSGNSEKFLPIIIASIALIFILF